MINILCKNCGNEFSIENWRIKRAKFCSKTCNAKFTHKLYPQKGLKRSDETRKKLSDSHKGQKPWCTGTKGVVKAWNKGLKGKQVAWNKGIHSWEGRKERLVMPMLSGEKHWNWKGGITEENHKIRDSKSYKDWRMQVLQRDRFSCIICGYRSHKPRDIRVDHIKPFSLFPELRLELSNGRTLCVPCDLKNGWRYARVKNDMKSNKL
jgi:5-methylcytosine-specific restriction endonuclease McrA